MNQLWAQLGEGRRGLCAHNKDKNVSLPITACVTWTVFPSRFLSQSKFMSCKGSKVWSIHQVFNIYSREALPKLKKKKNLFNNFVFNLFLQFTKKRLTVLAGYWQPFCWFRRTGQGPHLKFNHLLHNRGLSLLSPPSPSSLQETPWRGWGSAKTGD